MLFDLESEKKILQENPIALVIEQNKVAEALVWALNTHQKFTIWAMVNADESLLLANQAFQRDLTEYAQAVYDFIEKCTLHATVQRSAKPN